ncbi:MAG: hypothetical protein WD894_19925 [Pirellulales bacterium]
MPPFFTLLVVSVLPFPTQAAPVVEIHAVKEEGKWARPMTGERSISSLLINQSDTFQFDLDGRSQLDCVFVWANGWQRWSAVLESARNGECCIQRGYWDRAPMDEKLLLLVHHCLRSSFVSIDVKLPKAYCLALDQPDLRPGGELLHELNDRSDMFVAFTNNGSSANLRVATEQPTRVQSMKCKVVLTNCRNR